ncbi:unnamed protein product, partial [Didymodactylos carnosus]
IGLCHGCNQSLCNKHWIEHQQGLSDELENRVDEHNLLKEHHPHTTILSKDDMLKRIDHWKTKLFDIIKKRIEKGEECQLGNYKVELYIERAQTELGGLLEKDKHKYNKELKEICRKLNQWKEDDNYNEIDIIQCLKELEKIRIDMEKRSMIIHQIISKNFFTVTQ